MRNVVKLLNCMRCTICCTQPVVPVTDTDVKRLLDCVGEPVESIVRFYSPGQLEYDRDAGLWIRFRYGVRSMGLRKRNGHCRFLVNGDTCEVYAHRPMTCRTFPYQLELDDNECITAVEPNTAIKCCCTVGRDHDGIFQRVVRDICREDSEDDGYYEKVEKWNRRKPGGGTAEFLEFLGLK